MNVNAIWFESDKHKENYIFLVKKFHIGSDSEYESAAYVSAVPEIFNKISWNRKMENPIEWYWGKRIENGGGGYHEESDVAGTLSSSYMGLARAAVEMFTSRQHKFNLPNFLGNAGDKLFLLFIQALEIRRGRSVRFLMGKENL